MIETFKKEFPAKSAIDGGLTLISRQGLENIEYLLGQVQKDGIKGDFVETGVWRGGACIFAKAVINQLGLDCTVYVCDSFQGLPKPDKKWDADKGDTHYTLPELGVPRIEVEGYFKTYNLLDDRVVFVEGWFEDTMPKLKNEIQSIAILRLDGDMYGSTYTVLDNLYDLVPIGGVVIFDDFCLESARKAVVDFMKERDIDTPLEYVDNGIRYWRKTKI